MAEAADAGADADAVADIIIEYGQSQK